MLHPGFCRFRGFRGLRFAGLTCRGLGLRGLEFRVQSFGTRTALQGSWFTVGIEVAFGPSS